MQDRSVEMVVTDADRRSACTVIGVGNALRRDDGIGPAAIGALERAGVGTMAELIASDGEPARLLEIWSDRRLAVVVDAVVGDAAPGTVERIEIDADTVESRVSTSSHGPGLCEALALGLVLGRAPDRLVLYGVQPADLGFGPDLSPAVAAAMPVVVARVKAELDGASTAPGS